MSLEHRDDRAAGDEASSTLASNIVLTGGMACGKSTAGWLLARLIGYGFVDLDELVEARAGKKIQQIFEERGEDAFRELEADALRQLAGIRSHVIALGGGALMRDDSWSLIKRMGTLVWLNPPPEEIARRLVAKDPLSAAPKGPGTWAEDELRRRPLLADLADEKDLVVRHAKLAERMKALIGQRQDRYKQARVTISDSFATPESTAALIRDTLAKEGLVTTPQGQRPIDRWRIL